MMRRTLKWFDDHGRQMMRRTLKWFDDHGRELGTDLVGLAGFVVLVRGVSMWWPPAAWMIGGTILLAAAVVAGLKVGR